MAGSEWSKMKGDRTRRIKEASSSVIPNLITLGNAVCGFLALSFIATATGEVAVERVAGGAAVDAPLAGLEKAAWLIMLGMVFDVFDGRIARLTGSTSSLGAQLDSLADLVTFGVAPAGLMIAMHRSVVGTGPWDKVIWAFGLAYFLGATLRLARFNDEHDESEDSEEAHLCFKGMPTPAAAGCMAGLTIVYFWADKWKSWELRALADAAPAWSEGVATGLVRTMPFVAFLSGYAMVSNRLFYPHFASQLLQRRQSFDTLAYLVFGLTLCLVMFEPVLGFGFLAYMLWTPIRTLLKIAPSPAPPSEESAQPDGQ